MIWPGECGGFSESLVLYCFACDGGLDFFIAETVVCHEAECEITTIEQVRA